MKLNLAIRTFNGFGGGAAFGSVIALVELNEESFGDGLEEIELQLNFKSSLPFSKQRAPFSKKRVDSSLRAKYEEFHNQECAALPIRRFLRKKRRLKVETIANFASAEEAWQNSHPLNLEWQAAALDILIRELDLCRKKFKPADNFRFDDYLSWLRRQYENLPKTQREAKRLDRLWQNADTEKREHLSEWDALGLDWEDYHAAARDVVADHRLWNQGHDFAPNGNDNGADIIHSFRSEKSRWARGGGKAFYRNLARDWGFDPEAIPDDSIGYRTKRESIIGLAFAFLKLFAYCPDWLADETIRTIEYYKTHLALHHSEWEHRELCLEYQDVMLDCLKACPRKQNSDEP